MLHFQQNLLRLGVLRHVQHARRNIGITSALAVAVQKSAPPSPPPKTTLTDPIQQLFLDKVREYKSKSVGGKLVDSTPQTEASLKDELDKVDRMFSAAGKNMLQFPTFNFTDPNLDPIEVGEVKETEVASKVEEPEVEKEEDNKPYYEV